MPVAFRVEYAVVEVRDGRLLIHPDVYGSGRGVVREQVVQALVQIGKDPATLDQARLEALVRRAGRHGVSVPLDPVVAEPGRSEWVGAVMTIEDAAPGAWPGGLERRDGEGAWPGS